MFELLPMGECVDHDHTCLARGGKFYLFIEVAVFCVTSIAGRHIGIALAIVVVVGVGGVGVVVVVRFSD